MKVGSKVGRYRGGGREMPGGKSAGPSIKDKVYYEKLKKHFIGEGMKEEEAQAKAARISNAQARKR